MEIKEIEQYFDGGTTEIRIDDGRVYCIDDRLFTTTPNEIYDGYPQDDNSNLIKDSKQIREELIKLVEECNNEGKDIILKILKK